MADYLKRNSIIALAYSAQFYYPLTAQEIWLRLPLALSKIKKTKTRGDAQGDRSNHVSLALVEQATSQLLKEGLVFSKGGFFSLIPPSLWVDRAKRAGHSSKKINDAKTLFNFLEKLPWVLAVGVTGSVAVNNAREDDDLDLCIITEKHTLWFTRFLVSFFALLHRKQRTWHSERENSWCFNLWLEESNLKLSQKSPLYLAYELLQVCWVVNKNKTAEGFLHQNTWTKQIVPNLHHKALENLRQNKVFLGRKTNWYKPVVFCLNNIFYLAQRIYMQPHITREKVGYSFAFFHPRDTAREVIVGVKKTIEHWGDEFQLKRAVELAHQEKKRVVLATGFFDGFHREHYNFLKKAKKEGELLIVGVETDQRARAVKGEGRPFFPEEVRKKRIQEQGIADVVFILPKQFSHRDDYLALLQKIKPAVLAVSSHTAHLESKRELLKLVGGRVVVVHAHNPAVSSTLLHGSRSLHG